MSDTNLVAVGIVEEVTPGTTPPTPAFESLRITGAPSLAFAPTTVVSDELRSDRQVSDIILVGANAGGELAHELSHGALDTLMRGVMLNPWVERNNRKDAGITNITTNVITVVTGGTFAIDDLIHLEGFGDANDDVIFPAILTTNDTTITAASGLTDNADPDAGGARPRVRNVGRQGATADIETAVTPNRITSTTLDFTTLGLTVGQWIKVGGSAVGNRFDTAAVNDWVRISSISANALGLDVVPSGWVADAGTGKNIWLFFGDYLINGVDLRQYSIEERFLDHSPVTFILFTGMGVNTLNFQFTQQAIVTATAGFLGLSATVTETRFAGATDLAAPTNTIFNTSSNVGRIGRGASPISGPNFVLDATMQMNNNLRRQTAVGNLGAIGLGKGEIAITGNLNTYFGNKNLLQDVLDNTETSLDIRFKDNLDKVVLMDLPAVKYTSGAPGVPGKNQDVLINLGYQAKRHAVLGYTILIHRFHKTQV